MAMNDFDWLGLAYGITKLHVESLKLASTQNILDQDSARHGDVMPLDVKGKADGAAKAQLMTGTAGVTQSPWDVPVRPSRLPSLDVADKATGNAPDTDSPLVGNQGGGVPLPSSPLHKFAGELADSPTDSPLLRTAMTSPAIHSGDTIERLINAVARCEK